MTYAETVKFIIAMIIMMNPLGSLTIFLQLTHKSQITYQREIALRCGLAMIVLMLLSLWFGNEILDFMGITISSFRCAGGIILLLMGLSMLQSHESPVSYTPEDKIAANQRDSIALVPMATPIIIGPGTMSTLIIASTDYPEFHYKAWLSILCLLLSVSMCLILYYARTITKLVGESVVKAITRVMGMLIMAIAVGMLANGMAGLFTSLHNL